MVPMGQNHMTLCFVEFARWQHRGQSDVYDSLLIVAFQFDNFCRDKMKSETDKHCKFPCVASMSGLVDKLCDVNRVFVLCIDGA